MCFLQEVRASRARRRARMTVGGGSAQESPSHACLAGETSVARESIALRVSPGIAVGLGPWEQIRLCSFLEHSAMESYHLYTHVPQSHLVGTMKHQERDAGLVKCMLGLGSFSGPGRRKCTLKYYSAWSGHAPPLHTRPYLIQIVCALSGLQFSFMDVFLARCRA